MHYIAACSPVRLRLHPSASRWADDLSLMRAENDEQARRHRQGVVTGTGDDERRLTLPVFCGDTRLDR